MGEYARGIAFVLEGATEKVFYRAFLKWFAEQNNCLFVKGDNLDNGDIYFEWDNGAETILIKFNIVGTVTQVSHSGKWFANKCAKKYKMPWKVFLCYDTDSSEYDITKFYQDDWKLLRKDLVKAKAEEIIDLAASADIEDIILTDLSGVCAYLGIDVPEKLSGRKGKAKMKALYRSCGNTYHEGDKAETMIGSLNFQRIVDYSPLDLEKLSTALTKPQNIVDNNQRAT